MNNQKRLIIYNFEELYILLDEIKFQLGYELIPVNKPNIDSQKLKDENFDLILSKNEIPNFSNQLTLKDIPLKINDLIERINVGVLKNKFQNQSEIKIGKFIINLNSREMSLKDLKLKLTEKEANMIIYLSKSKTPITVNQLQNVVWGYQSDLETHTVETHVYRLRKKIFMKFSENNFIISNKNGYKIN